MQTSKTPITWTNIDHSKNRNEYVSFLDNINTLAAITNYKQRTFDLLDIKANQYLLDVGAGTGQDAIYLAQLVGPNGKVIALDKSATMIAEAKRHSPNNNLPIECMTGNAHSLSFDDNYFDGCRADRVFQHLENTELALSEMIRVAKPGANIVISEPDWQTLVIDSSLSDETDIILSTICTMIRNAHIGRQLLGMFKRAGLADISISTATLMLNDFASAALFFQLDYGIQLAESSGALSAKLSKQWLKEQRLKSEQQQFFASLTGFAVCGKKQ